MTEKGLVTTLLTQFDVVTGTEYPRRFLASHYFLIVANQQHRRLLYRYARSTCWLRSSIRFIRWRWKAFLYATVTVTVTSESSPFASGTFRYTAA